MEKPDTPTAQPQTVTDKLKENSLKAAGLTYLFADSALAAARIMEGDKSGAAGGILWGVGSLAAARYGSPNEEKQLELLSKRLGDYLKKQGVEIPKNPDTQALTKEGGVIDHIEKFLYAHPSEVLNAIYAVGGGLLVKGGMQTNMKSDIASGALVVAGGLAGILIPEKTPDKANPPKTAFGKIKEWAQAKPLRVSGSLYQVNNIFMGVGVYAKTKSNGDKRKALIKEGKSNEITPALLHSHKVRFLSTASFVLANIFLGTSSKGHAGGAADVTGEIAEKASLVIAVQPKEVQEALVQSVAGYLSSQPEIDKTAPEIAFMLHEKLHQTRTQFPQQASWQERLSYLALPSTDIRRL